MTRTCLVVDDSRVVRKVARRILEAHGYTVAEAADGQQALDALSPVAMPDCVLLDWNMPVMNGLDFLKQLRAEYGPDNPPVVFCTTETDMSAIETGNHERRAGIHHEAVRRGDPHRQVRAGRLAVTARRTTGACCRAESPVARVMVCDNSAVIRGAIARMLDADPAVRVVARVGNGQAAIDELRRTPVGCAGARHRDAGDGRHDRAAFAAARRSRAQGDDGVDADHAGRRHRTARVAARCGRLRAEALRGARRRNVPPASCWRR